MARRVRRGQLEVVDRLAPTRVKRQRPCLQVGIHADEGLDAWLSGFGLRRTLVGLKPDPQVPFRILLQPSRLLSLEMWVGIHADKCLPESC